MFAIKNKRTGEWVFGTNWRCSPPRQRLHPEQAVTYRTRGLAESDFKNRECHESTYKIVAVELREIAEVSVK